MPLLLDILAPILDAEPESTRTEFLLELLNSNPIFGWGIALFTVLAMVAAAVAALTGNLSSIIDFFRNYLFLKPAEITEEQRQSLRQQLLSALNRDVSKRLEDSLHNLVRIDIKQEEQRQRVGRSNLPLVEEDKSSQTEGWVNRLGKRLFQSFNAESKPEDLIEATPTLKLFNRPDVQGRLLILGEPGSGKTTELLSLAQDLISQAQKNLDSPIPVIFEATAWKDGYPFEDWLVAQLEVQYQLPKQVAQSWIKTNQLLPLLDGLDELGLAGQVGCIKSANEFLSRYLASPMVVCCRCEEYEQGKELLDQLNGVIYLQPVTDEQIQQYFKDLNREYLWASVQADVEIGELARSPLFLTMLVVAYQGQPIHTVQELLDVYIDKQLRDLNNQGAYPLGKYPSQQQTEYYLGWLATRLDDQGTTEFLIERLQPSWLERCLDRNLYRLMFGLSVGLFSGGSICLSAGLRFGLSVGLMLGLFAGLIFGLSVVRFRSLSNIEPVERLGFSWKGSLRNVLSAVPFFVLMFGLIGGLSVGLHGGLTVGLSAGLSGGLISVESQIYDKRLPNQGIKISIRSAIITGTFFGLLLGLSVGLVRGLNLSLYSAAIGGMFASLIGGLESAIQHLCLRLVLYRSGVAPWNYESFLKHAENHRFIQRVGGRYRFMHDLLRKRFAERYRG